jgi:hypothetical protein
MQETIKDLTLFQPIGTWKNRDHSVFKEGRSGVRRETDVATALARMPVSSTASRVMNRESQGISLAFRNK